MENKNAAYDLSQFQTKQSEAVKPELHIVQKDKKKNSPFSIMRALPTLCLSLTIFAMVLMILYTNAMINEVGVEVEKLTATHTEMVAQNEKLRMDIENNMSIKDVEKYAKEELGMDIVEPYQVEYVNMAPDDRIEIKEREENESIIASIMSAIFS